MLAVMFSAYVFMFVCWFRVNKYSYMEMAQNTHSYHRQEQLTEQSRNETFVEFYMTEWEEWGSWFEYGRSFALACFVIPKFTISVVGYLQSHCFNDIIKISTDWADFHAKFFIFCSVRLAVLGALSRAPSVRPLFLHSIGDFHAVVQWLVRWCSHDL